MIRKGMRRKQFRKKRMSIVHSIALGNCTMDENKSFDLKMQMRANANSNMIQLHPTSPTLGERMKMFEQTAAGIGMLAQNKVQKIKAERGTKDQNIILNQQQRQKAIRLLQEYAQNKCKHIADITLIDQTIKGDITRDNCLEKLENLNILSWIYVKKNAFERWNERNAIANAMNEGKDNKAQYEETPTEYIKMCNITLLNSKVLIKLNPSDQEAFKQLILLSIEQCPSIYMINFNASNICNNFLDKIVKTLSRRQQNEQRYGPELLLLENNPITDRGISMLCQYVAQNGAHLKCLKVGHCFGTISTKCCQQFCDALKANEQILKVTFDMRWNQHRQLVDKSLKRNYAKYRKEQKMYKEQALRQML